MDLIVVTMPPKYTVFTSLNTTSSLLMTTVRLPKINKALHLALWRRSLAEQKTQKWTLMRSARGNRKGKQKEITVEDGSLNNSGTSTALQITYHNKPIYDQISDEPKIELGATYNPNLLPDHCGNYFQHPKARLIQQDYRNINKDLIPPWKTYEALTAETIVLIDATVNCWKMKVNEDSYRKVSLLKWLAFYQIWFVLEIYQFSARSLRVIVESDVQPDIPPIPILPAPKTNQSSSSTPSPSKRSRAFDDFDVSPNKKKSPIKSNKAGSSGRKLWIIWKDLDQYHCVLNSSRIITFVTTYSNFIQYLAWPRYLTLYARNFITINFIS